MTKLVHETVNASINANNISEKAIFFALSFDMPPDGNGLDGRSFLSISISK